MQILIPTKHLQLHSCLLFKTAIMIKLLSKYQRIPLDLLYRKIKDEVAFLSYSDFILSLDILFLLGKLKYYENTDRVEYIK